MPGFFVTVNIIILSLSLIKHPAMIDFSEDNKRHYFAMYTGVRCVPQHGGVYPAKPELAKRKSHHLLLRPLEDISRLDLIKLLKMHIDRKEWFNELFLQCRLVSNTKVQLDFNMCVSAGLHSPFIMDVSIEGYLFLIRQGYAVPYRGRTVEELQYVGWLRLERKPQPVIYPDVCPYTGRPFFMAIEYPGFKNAVPTYGGPFDSYSIPFMEAQDGSFTGEWVCLHYCHDRGEWVGWEDVTDIVGGRNNLVVQNYYEAEEKPTEEPETHLWPVIFDPERDDEMHLFVNRTIKKFEAQGLPNMAVHHIENEIQGELSNTSTVTVKSKIFFAKQQTT